MIITLKIKKRAWYASREFLAASFVVESREDFGIATVRCSSIMAMVKIRDGSTIHGSDENPR
jgi:hypothetical protein